MPGFEELNAEMQRTRRYAEEAIMERTLEKLPRCKTGKPRKCSTRVKKYVAPPVLISASGDMPPGNHKCAF